MFLIFSANQWNQWHELKLEEKLGALTLKKLCTTRWTSKIGAVRAVRDNYVDLFKILTPSPSHQIRGTKEMDSHEFIVYSILGENLSGFSTKEIESSAKNIIKTYISDITDSNGIKANS